MAIDPIKNTNTDQQVTWREEEEKLHGQPHGGQKPKAADTDDPDDPNSPQSQYLQMLKDAGIDTDQFKAAIQEAKSEDIKPGSPQFGQILKKYGIDASKVPQPPAGLGKHEDLRHGHHHKKKVQQDETYDQMLKDAGIDPDDYDAAVQEADQADVDPGTDAYNAILSEYGIDPTKVPPPPVAGSEGGPSKDSRQFNLDGVDSAKMLNRSFGGDS